MAKIFKVCAVELGKFYDDSDPVSSPEYPARYSVLHVVENSQAAAVEFVRRHYPDFIILKVEALALVAGSVFSVSECLIFKATLQNEIARATYKGPGGPTAW